MLTCPNLNLMQYSCHTFLQSEQPYHRTGKAGKTGKMVKKIFREFESFEEHRGKIREFCNKNVNDINKIGLMW